MGEHSAETDSPVENAGRFIKSPKGRKWLYGIGAALAAVLVGYGILTPDQSQLWLDLLNAALVPTLIVAAANTNSKE